MLPILLGSVVGLALNWAFLHVRYARKRRQLVVEREAWLRTAKENHELLSRGWNELERVTLEILHRTTADLRAKGLVKLSAKPVDDPESN